MIRICFILFVLLLADAACTGRHATKTGNGNPATASPLPVKERLAHLSLPLGMARMEETNFPARIPDTLFGGGDDWNLETVDADDYHSLYAFANNFYTSLYDSLPAVFEGSRYTRPVTRMELDTSYRFNSSISLSATIPLKNGYCLLLYRDNGVQAVVDELHTKMDYLVLYSAQKDRMIDSLTVYYNEHNLVLRNKRFFRIERDGSVRLYDFKEDDSEDATLFLERQQYKLLPDGKFQRSSN